MFIELLKKRLLAAAPDYFPNNYDHYKDGVKRPVSKKVINAFKAIAFSPIGLNILLANESIYRNLFLNKLGGLKEYIDKLEYLFNNVEDENSKKLIIDLIAFKILGYIKVKLPLNSESYWNGIQEIESCKKGTESIKLTSFPWNLDHYDFRKVGVPIEMYYSPKAAFTTFKLEQYKLNIPNGSIEARKGDVAFDLGGCYGDTALYFSNKVGSDGAVYCFEFIPGNIEVINKNLALNNEMSKNITVVPHPVWEKSGINTYFKDEGASSHISFEEFAGYTGKTTTLTIDDFVKQNNLQNVNFIKADIEGAEPFALRGAEETIKKFKPNLAICIYHNMDDFTGIIKQLKDMNVGYKFYIGQFTIYFSEVVLFATAQS